MPNQVKSLSMSLEDNMLNMDPFARNDTQELRLRILMGHRYVANRPEAETEIVPQERDVLHIEQPEDYYE